MTASWPDDGGAFKVQFEPVAKLPLLPVFQKSALTPSLRSEDSPEANALPAESVMVAAFSMPAIRRSAVVSLPTT
jgi:hypothetical protein